MDAAARLVRRRYDRIARFYDLLEAPMEHRVARWRREIAAELAGRVLEVGVGTGQNVPYYPPGVEVVAIDISHRMLARAKARFGDRANVRFAEMDAQRLAFADDTFDTVLATCVFCSVPDPVAGLREIGRVCRPGGRILLIEHVRSEKRLIGPLMDLLNPISLHLWGANINRRTIETIRAAGLDDVRVVDLWSDIFKRVAARPAR